jgi:hypothetical protein
VGQEHVLAAAIDGRRLRVWADGGLAWEGELDDEVLASVGPAGMRSDNGRFEVALAARVRPDAACGGGGGDGDED